MHEQEEGYKGYKIPKEGMTPTSLSDVGKEDMQKKKKKNMAHKADPGAKENNG